MSTPAPAAFDPQPRGRLRGAIMLLPVLIWAFGYMFWLLIMTLIAPGWVRNRAVGIIRCWGSVILKMLGIRLEVFGREHFGGDEPRILLFNHVNVFDLVVLSAVWDRGCSVIYKKEFHKIPMMGRLMRFFGMIPIDRANRERALKSMSEVSGMIRDRNKKVMVAPEGTRSHDGRLGPFKRGPFHLALETRAPVVPLIMRGPEVLVPGLSSPPRTGRIRVDILEPIPTEDWTVSTLEEHIALVRARFLELVPDGVEG
jgi:putative phosphoserine phosphatase/1-acylglycerol-3-phosphate O-acyltransferase